MKTENREANAADEVEVTPEMIEVGVRAFWSFDARFEGAEDVVLRIWYGMTAARIYSTKEVGNQNPLT